MRALAKATAAGLRLSRNLGTTRVGSLAYTNRTLQVPFVRRRLYSSDVKLTSETYDLKRDSRYSQLNDEDLAFFKSVLPKTGVITDENDLEAFNEDWMRKYRGSSKLVLKPSTIEQVSKIVEHCNRRKLAIVPQGGNTGLVGGSIPLFDEIVISLVNMNKIRSFDNVSGVLVADAGVILENADLYLRENGYIFPLDLGAKGTCHIGGNVATNAGGLRLLRYGSLHGTVLGVEAVLPDGTIFNGLSHLRKDNTGYDLKQLFIGSEGTIGIITGVSVLCPVKPSAVNVAFLGLESYEKVQQTFVEVRKDLGEILSAFEFMDNQSLGLVEKHSDLVFPLENKYPFYVLIETSGSNKDHDDAKLEAFLERALTDELITDGVVAQDEGQVKSLWSWREMIPEGCGKGGGVYKYDMSMPLSKMYDMVTDVRTRLSDAGMVGDTPDFPVIESAGYGHIGDGNLHLNVALRYFDKRVEKLLEPFVFEWISKVNGSISAEHGLGFAKKKFLSYSKSEGTINQMKSIKNHFDPNGIMNPYKYI